MASWNVNAKVRNQVLSRIHLFEGWPLQKIQHPLKELLHLGTTLLTEQNVVELQYRPTEGHTA